MTSIVVTGMGALGAPGDADAIWRCLMSGPSTFAPHVFEMPKVPQLPPMYVARLGHVPWSEFFPSAGRRSLNLESEVFLIASSMAIRQAKLSPERAEDLGIYVGTRHAGLDDYSHFYLEGLIWGARRVSPVRGPNTGFNAPASHASIRLTSRGPNLTVSARDTASLQAIAFATDSLLAGRAEAMIAGGVDVLSYLRLWQLRGKSDPVSLPRPYDRTRMGTVPGEGAVALVLELEEGARRRGVEALAYVLSSAVAFDPEPRVAGKRAIRQALETSGLNRVDAIFSSASGYRGGDADEALALREGLEQDLSTTPTCAVLGATGHWAGASGALQVLAAVRAMRSGVVPRTAGFSTRDPDLPALGVSTTSTKFAPRSALVCSLDAAGHAAALVVSNRPTHGALANAGSLS